MREMFWITGRDLCDSIPESEDFGSIPSTTSRRGKVAQFELDDDYDIDSSFDVAVPTETEEDDHVDE